MPAVQARQIANLLQDFQAIGVVRNQDEYRQKLQELSIIVNSAVPKPSFEQVRALMWNLCSSDGHNVMMRSFKNDIEAAFLQVDEIGAKLDEHNELLMKNIIADLERGLAEQENMILVCEEKAKTNEFNHVLVNSFASSSLLQVARSDFGADSLYFDNRTYQKQTQEQLPSAMVSKRGGKLIINTTNDSEPVVHPVGVTLSSDSNSYNTEIEVDIDSDINNIIDDKRGTFWHKNVLLSTIVPKVTTVIEFALGSGQDISYIIVQGATSEPFFIESIEGIAPDGSRTVLNSTSTEVNGETRIDFSKTFLSNVKVTFAVYTYHKADYWVSDKVLAHNILDPKRRFDTLARRDNLAPVSTDALASKKLTRILNVPKTLSKQINSYRYTFGLDNVWFGNSIYKDTGIFVSKPLTVKDAGVLVIRADETIATDDIDKNTIEYEIIKIDKSPKYKETRFPILKDNESSLITERLILFKRDAETIVNDVGVLRFCPYIPNDWVITEDDPIIIYRNGVALTLGTDWEFAFAEEVGINKTLDWEFVFTAGTTFSDYTLSPPKMWIKIKNVKLNDIYTVTYTPRSSDYNINVADENEQRTLYLDKDKTVSLYRDGKERSIRVHFERTNPDVTIESEIYLQVTLRRNKTSQSSSPELNKYTVLVANYVRKYDND